MAFERHATPRPVDAHSAEASAPPEAARLADGCTLGTAARHVSSGLRCTGLASLAGGCAPNTATMPALANPPSSPAKPVERTASQSVATASQAGGQRVRPLGGQQLGQAS